MTEQEWLACEDAQAMVRSVCGGWSSKKSSQRRLRLLACALCRRVWPLLLDERSRHAIRVAEKFSDGYATRRELSRAGRAAFSAWSDMMQRKIASGETTSSDTRMPEGASSMAAHAAAKKPHPVADSDCVEQLFLVRHILGNPFRPYLSPSSWPSTVVQLADALYNGQDCGFALHDALLEAGHPELANHFQQETHHPKGCWALDLILGKE